MTRGEECGQRTHQTEKTVGTAKKKNQKKEKKTRGLSSFGEWASSVFVTRQ